MTSFTSHFTHRSPQSWGGSDRTKFYHPPLPLRRGPPTPGHTTPETKPMVVPPFWNPRKTADVPSVFLIFAFQTMVHMSKMSKPLGPFAHFDMLRLLTNVLRVNSSLFLASTSSLVSMTASNKNSYFA